MPVLTIGDQFPDYELTAVVPGNLKDVAADRKDPVLWCSASQRRW